MYHSSIKQNLDTSAYSQNFLIRYDSTIVDLDVIHDFLSNPDHFFDAGQIISSPWKSAATDKSIVGIKSKMFFIKRYNCMGNIYRTKNMFRKSKALKSWLAGSEFLNAGISTPRPIACLEERHYRLLGRSYLLCELIDDAQNLLDAWHSLDNQKRIQLLCLAGTEIGYMHHQGFLHGDLNWRNVLIQEKINHEKIFLVDLDGCRSSKNIDEKAASRDLNHFYRDLERNNATRENIDFFSKSWQSASRKGRMKVTKISS